MTEDQNSLFKAKHHSVGEDAILDMNIFVAAKNSSVSFQDRGRFFVQPIIERTLHSGSAEIEGNYCIGSNAGVDGSIPAVILNNSVTVGPYKENGAELRRFLTGKDA